MKSIALHKISKGIALVVLIAAMFGSSVAKITPQEAVSSKSSTRPAQFMNYLPALADFDGDSRLDYAELHLAGSHHCIRVCFGNYRETHLDFGTRTHAGGVLLVRDVNRDNTPDLIWVYDSRSEPAVVWLNDGAGHFERSRDENVRARASSLFGNADYRIAADFEYQQVCLVPAPSPSEFAQVTNLENEFVSAVVIAVNDFRDDLAQYLSYLRERGPPQSV